MPDMVTLRDIVNTFTEQELDLTIPLEYKDVDANSYPYVNQYNSYLSVGDYESAYNYRVENSAILEPLIHDAKKANTLLAIAINSYLFAKGEKTAANISFDNSFNSDVTATNVQDAIEGIAVAADTYITELYNKIYSLETENANLKKQINNLETEFNDKVKEAITFEWDSKTATLNIVTK